MFMNDVRRTFGNATTLPSKEEVILPTSEEETAEEIYAILLDDSENYAPCLEEGDVDLAALVLKFVGLGLLRWISCMLLVNLSFGSFCSGSHDRR